MTKQEFLKQLKGKLKGLPKSEVGERLTFYSEMIEDRREEGLSEEDAVLAVGSVTEISQQILEELSLKRIDSEVAARKKLRVWEIVLLILGSPLWIPLLIVAFAVVFVLYVVLWAVNLCLWVVELLFLIVSLISKYILIACKKMTIGSWFLTRKGCVVVKKIFPGKE